MLIVADDKDKLEDDFDVGYLLELATDVAVFVSVDDLHVLDLTREDEDS